MAETQTTQTKRHRDEEEEEETHDKENFEEETKRHKSYNQILSILEEDEIESTEDLSSIFTTLQQELSSSSCDDFASFDPLLCPITSDYGPAPQAQSTATKQGERQGDDEKESVIRHLLEASDDELGLPNRVDGGGGGGGGYDYEINGGDLADSFGDGLWEFEDEAANYCTLLQSELFR